MRCGKHHWDWIKCKRILLLLARTIELGLEQREGRGICQRPNVFQTYLSEITQDEENGAWTCFSDGTPSQSYQITRRKN